MIDLKKNSMKHQMRKVHFIYNNFMMMALTYSEITVAMAAPLTPSPRINIKIGSSIAFNRLPTPAKCKQHTVIHVDY